MLFELLCGRCRRVAGRAAADAEIESALAAGSPSLTAPQQAVLRDLCDRSWPLTARRVPRQPRPQPRWPRSARRSWTPRRSGPMTGPITQIEVGLVQNFCTLVGDDSSGLCAVVDPAFEIDRILRAVAARGRRWQRSGSPTVTSITSKAWCRCSAACLLRSRSTSEPTTSCRSWRGPVPPPVARSICDRCTGRDAAPWRASRRGPAHPRSPRRLVVRTICRVRGGDHRRYALCRQLRSAGDSRDDGDAMAQPDAACGPAGRDPHLSRPRLRPTTDLHHRPRAQTNPCAVPAKLLSPRWCVSASRANRTIRLWSGEALRILRAMPTPLCAVKFLVGVGLFSLLACSERERSQYRCGCSSIRPATFRRRFPATICDAAVGPWRQHRRIAVSQPGNVALIRQTLDILGMMRAALGWRAACSVRCAVPRMRCACRRSTTRWRPTSPVVLYDLDRGLRHPIPRRLSG